MKVLVDTNILFSALLFPESKPAQALNYAVSHYDLTICDQCILEFEHIIEKKAPQFAACAADFIESIQCDIIKATSIFKQEIRDIKDQPILNAAIQNKIDVIITGDKDFLSLNLEFPKCMTAAEFLERFVP